MSWSKWLGIDHDPAVEELLDTLSWCNQAAATTNANASSGALQSAASVGARFEHAVASALLTMGKVHGPLKEARELLYHTMDSDILDMLTRDMILPGWGNSFYKKSIDPAFVPMDHLLRETYHGHYKKIDNVSEFIHEVKGFVLYPNAATYGAVASEILGLVRGTETILFIAARLPSWQKLYAGATR